MYANAISHLSITHILRCSLYGATFLRGHKGGEVTSLPNLMRTIAEKPLDVSGMTDDFCAIGLISWL